MNRYIDADKLIADIKHLCWVSKAHEYDAIKCIKKQPTADVVEVRHGEYHNTRFTDGVFYQEQCSICGEWTYEYDKNFCPHCGSKMDGEGREDDGT